MEKYIRAIIEIVLDNICCHHQEIEEHPRGPKFDDPTYSLDNEQEVIKKCLELKSEIMFVDKEEFIEKRARAMHAEVYGSLVHCDFQCNMMARFRVQIRKTLKEAK